MKSYMLIVLNFFIILEAKSATSNKSPRTATPITTGYGFPITCETTSLTAGPKGPMLLQDAYYIDKISHFNRERIAERVVHAKGGGAFGYFECLHEIPSLTKAIVFSKPGKRTDVFVRFSVVGGESGSADTVRDPRGFAVKLYTEHGIWDLVGNNTPIFFIRDSILFPDFIHSQKRNTTTHLKDANMFWDFLSLRSESTHQVLRLFSDQGIPDGFRYMNGFPGHTFKCVNATGAPLWCKFHFKSDQGIRNLTVADAEKLAGTNPDYSIEDLFNAIKAGDFPSWTMYIQTMTLEEAGKYRWNPFDITKIWLESDYPLKLVGRLVLNRNPSNYFEQVEQAAFAPSHMIPGIEPSPDKMLQGRLFAYGDTQRYRVGTNHLELPINKSPYVTITNQQQDGKMTYHNQAGVPNYIPNSYGGSQSCVNTDTLPFPVQDDVNRYDDGNDDNFSQPKYFLDNELDDSQRDRLTDNLASSLKNANEEIRNRAVENFAKVDPELGKNITIKIQKMLNKKSR